MTIDTVIESLSAYQAVRNVDPKGPRVWWTTSPYLLENLPKEGEQTCSLEDDIDLEETNNLAKAGYAFADRFTECLNNACAWRKYADLRLVFARSLNNCFFVTFYKGLLLQKMLQRLNGSAPLKALCAGDPEEIGVEGLDIPYRRFDTVYALIARRANQAELEVFHHSISSDKLTGLHRDVVFRRFSFMEKLLSIINNTPGSFSYKAWRTCKAKGLYPFAHIRLRPRPRSSFYIYKDCELIEELFLALLLRGGSVAQLGTMPRINPSPTSTTPLPDSALLQERFDQQLREELAKKGVPYYPLFAACCLIVWERLLTALERLGVNLPHITDGFERLTQPLNSNSMILTNAFNSTVERLFYCYCRMRKIRTAAFEHGVTLGLSEFSLWIARQSGMTLADTGFYHNRKAIKAVAPHAPHQEMVLAGLPRVTGSVIMPLLQRPIARKWMNLRKRDHVVVYVADLEKNNSIYGPHAENDLQYLEKTKSIMAYLAKSFPHSKLILKLYPTQRYVDSYQFGDLRALYNDLRIVKNVDYRFIRAAADETFVTSSQSTLGWVAGSGTPYHFVDLNWSPSLFRSRVREETSIPELGPIFRIPKEELTETSGGDNFELLFQSSKY